MSVNANASGLEPWIRRQIFFPLSLSRFFAATRVDNRVAPDDLEVNDFTGYTGIMLMRCFGGSLSEEDRLFLRRPMRLPSIWISGTPGLGLSGLH